LYTLKFSLNGKTIFEYTEEEQYQLPKKNSQITILSTAYIIDTFSIFDNLIIYIISEKTN